MSNTQVTPLVGYGPDSTALQPAAVATGPKGDTGATGATGAQGVQGATGLTGQQGQAGPTGLTGATGSTGSAGAAGAQGIQGQPGATGQTGLTGAAGAKGDAGAQGVQGIDGALSIQRTRAQTNTSGLLTWTFPNPFSAGVTPIIEVTVESAAVASWNHAITAISNTSVTIQLGKTTAVTVLGVSVLGVASAPQAFVHLTAIAP